VFDEIVHTLPEEGVPQAVKQTGKDTLKFDGIAAVGAPASPHSCATSTARSGCANPELEVVRLPRPVAARASRSPPTK